MNLTSLNLEVNETLLNLPSLQNLRHLPLNGLWVNYLLKAQTPRWRGTLPKEC